MRIRRFSNGCPTEKLWAVGSMLAVGEWTDWRDENEQHRHRYSRKEDVAPLPFARSRGCTESALYQVSRTATGSAPVSAATEACKQLAVVGSGV